MRRHDLAVADKGTRADERVGSHLGAVEHDRAGPDETGARRLRTEAASHCGDETGDQAQDAHDRDDRDPGERPGDG